MSSRPSTFSLTDPGPHRVYNTIELLRLPPPEWLIDGIMPKGGLVGLYGPPGVGKSFLAIDMALAISAGVPWQGHGTKKGFVLYVAAEGGTGISIRALAWLRERGVSAGDADVGWLPEAIPIYSESEDLEHVIDRIDEEIKRYPILIVIDTLARCFDGNENEQEDMGRFISGADHLRKKFGSTVLVVHHTRLDGQRERGNTAFRGACDTMLSVGRGDKHSDIVLACSKQKDAEEFPLQVFKLKVVGLQVAEGSEFKTSAVIASEFGDKDARILKAIKAAGDDGIGFTQLKSTLTTVTGSPDKQAYMSPATMKRRLVSLVEKRQIVRKNARYYIAGSVEETP